MAPEHGRQGSLHLLLGAAPCAGKTYALLAEGSRLAALGRARSAHRVGARLRTRRAAQGSKTSYRDYPSACRPSGCSWRHAGNDIP